MKDNGTGDYKRAGSSFADDGGAGPRNHIRFRTRILDDDPGIAFRDNRIVQDSIDPV